MAERPRPGSAPDEGTPEYRWLYGDGQSGPDAERTQYLRTPHPPQQPGQQRPGQQYAGQQNPAAPAPGARQAPPQRPDQRPAQPAKERPARRPRRRRAPVWRIVKLALLLWLVFLVAVPFYALSSISRVDAITDYEGRPADQSPTTYLIVGSDSRAGLTEAEQKELGTGPDDVGQRTDTIMLLHTGSGPDVLTSIPRDSRVEIPGRGVSKINAAFAWGGAPLLVETVERNTGIQVDHYVEIGFGGLVKMVDAVGGVEICPPRKMKDKQANLDIEAGCQEVDGATALGYARSRKTYKALGDVDRAKAQREVVAALGAKALSPMTVVNPVRYFGLATATASSITVSEDTGVFALAKFGLGMTGTELSCGVPLADLSVRWDSTRSEEYFTHLRNDTADEMPKALCTPSGFAD